MAAIKRVSPLKPGLRGARNWVTAQVRAANYSRKGFWRLTLGLLFILFSIVFMALWLGGFLPDAKKSSDNFFKNRLMSMGFVVDQVDVMGEGAISERDVMRAVGVNKGDYLFALDLEAAQNRVENIAWVERAIVRRLWPDRIVVQIIERKPYALWQDSGSFHLVDRTGEVISRAALENHPDLPLIVGADAPEKFKVFNEALLAYPELKSRTSSLVFHNTMRWDALIDNGRIRVKLPRDNVEGALKRLSLLQANHQILDREIAHIDLRLADRISLLPTQDEPV